MPEKSQTISVVGYDASKLQSIAYGALQQLNWTIKYAGENKLLAYTPRSWNRYDNEITIVTEDGQLTATSKMIHGETFDMTGRTKKDIANFLAAFETVKAKVTDLNVNEWNEKIALLKSETIKVAEQETKQAEETDKVMNFSKSNLYVTYGIIAINVIVFVIMTGSGVSLFAPTGIDIMKWGGNFAPLTLSGDWWRLISCVFVHIGVVHIVFNMYALFMAGIYLEPMLGKARFISAYLCTGVFASLASLWWHKEPITSAGASGAIFGMYGVFLALLSTNLIPKQVRKGLLQSIGVFVVYNLVYGIKSGVDNSAHVGGLLSGLLIGYIYFPGLRPGGKKSVAIPALIAIVTVGVTIFYLQENRVTNEIRNKTLSEIEEFKYKDADKYNVQLEKFADAEEKALAPLRDTSLADEQLAEKLQNISLPEWEKADESLEKIKAYDISGKAKEKAEQLQVYVSLRKEQAALIRQLILQKDETLNTQLNELGTKINRLLEELKE